MFPQMAHVSSTTGQIPFPVMNQGKSPQFGFAPNQAMAPMMFLPASTPPHVPQNFGSPGMPAMQVPLQPIPLQPQTSVASNVSETDGETAEGETCKPHTTTPMFQSFQPIQLMNMANPMIMNYNGQAPSPNLIPCHVLPVQTPNGPMLQPVYYVPQTTDMPGLRVPEQHPVQRQDSSASASVGRSTSFDGSEISDSGDAHRYHSNSLVRHHSSGDSRDGYGSDCSNSRLGSEYFEGSFCSENGEEEVNSKKFPPGLNIGSSSSFVSDSSYSTRKSSHSEEKPRKKSQDRYSKRYQYSQDGKKRPTSKERQEELFKTELCNYWINGQKCRFGKRCIFAHGQHELRQAKRKIERNRLGPRTEKKIVSSLSKLTKPNFDSLSTQILCTAVEEIRGNKQKSLVFCKAVFNKAVNQPELSDSFADMWRKLLNIHPMAQTFANQMQGLCLAEYNNPCHEASGLATMSLIASFCAKKTLKGEETAHKILSDMFSENASEKNVELWCKLIESLKNNVDTNKYINQLTAMKTRFNARVRFTIMDLEDLKKRNWVRRQ